MSKNVYLISVEMIKARTAIHGNIDPELVKPEIKTAQDMYILPLIGTALYTKIQTDIQATGTTTGVYKTLLDDYIADTLVWYTLSELSVTLSFQFWNKGVARKVGDFTELPSMNELIDLQNKYKNRAEFYANRTRLYLKENSTLFTEYLNPGSGSDTIQPDGNSFTMPLWLGDNENKKSFEERFQGNKPSC